MTSGRRYNPALTSRGACPESPDSNHVPRDDPWLAVPQRGDREGPWCVAPCPGAGLAPGVPFQQTPSLLESVAPGLSPEAREAALGHTAICPLSPQRRHLRAVTGCNPIRDRTRTWGSKTRDILISGFPQQPEPQTALNSSEPEIRTSPSAADTGGLPGGGLCVCMRGVGTVCDAQPGTVSLPRPWNRAPVPRGGRSHTEDGPCQAAWNLPAESGTCWDCLLGSALDLERVSSQPSAGDDAARRPVQPSVTQS